MKNCSHYIANLITACSEERRKHPDPASLRYVSRSRSRSRHRGYTKLHHLFVFGIDNLDAIVTLESAFDVIWSWRCHSDKLTVLKRMASRKSRRACFSPLTRVSLCLRARLSARSSYSYFSIDSTIRLTNSVV